MTSSRTLGIVAVAWSLLVTSRPEAFPRDEGPGLRSTPPMQTAELPRPPQQEERWVPPKSGLPEAVIDAARELFEQGFADPRGCEYCAVELAGEAEAHRNAVTRPPTTHAWVIPTGTADGPRFAVAWNGLVYPLKAVGPAVALEADVRALLAPPDARAAGKRLFVRPESGSSWNLTSGGAIDNIRTATQQELIPAKAILLVRLGRADLAAAVWKAGMGQSAGEPKGGVAEDRAWYLQLAADWAWALLDRAASVHSRGDDRLALASLRELARIQPLIEDKAEDLKLPRPPDVYHRGAVAPYLTFLAPLPTFLADQERRAREPNRVSALKSAFTSPAARIAALIADFDQISQPLWFSQGRTSLAGDAVVQAVIKEGDVAVGPLLKCLERDDRLTRTVDRDYRHFSRYIHVQGVDEAAHTALCAILGTREFGPKSRFYSGSSNRAERETVAAEIRAYWLKTRGLRPEERFFQTLADDAATPAQWLDAAEALAQPNDVLGRGGSSYRIRHRPGGKVPPLRGEPLRTRTLPSLTEVMARRAAELDPGGRVTQGSGAVFKVHEANRMAFLLADWDLKGALPTLKDRVLRCVDILRDGEAATRPTDGLEDDIARLTLLRVEGKDESALRDYAEWVGTLTPARFRFGYPDEMFEPWWRYADRSVMVTAAMLFKDPESPWVPLFRPREPGWSELGNRSDMITSPLLGIGTFRKLVLAGLADDRPSGSVQCDAAGKVSISVDARMTMLPVFRADDPHRPRPNSSMTLRLRDLYAWKLQQVRGFPRFELHWSPDLRDRMIAAVMDRLKQYGDRFKTTDVSQSLYEKAPFYPRHIKAVLVFPVLDHPATPDDVAAGRAIFSLAPSKEVRQWPLPAFPMEARWSALEIPADDPGLGSYDPSKGKPTAQIQYLQGGLVWQAEEVREGDRWRRYYGFVGRHDVAKVPAEQIDFPAPWNTGWYPISPDLEARFVPPGGRDDGRLILTKPVPTGGPLPILVTFRNARGIAATTPTALARKGEGQVLALRAGVSIRVFRAPESMDGLAGQQQQVQGANAPPWPEVMLRREPARYSSDAARALAPTETAEVLRLDLRDLFELDRPGRYRVDVALDDIPAEKGKPGLTSAPFTLETKDGAGR
jgi:hypothetical protein